MTRANAGDPAHWPDEQLRGGYPRRMGSQKQGIELETLLASAATDPSQRPGFAQALLASDVFVLGNTDVPASGGVIPSGAKISLVTWHHEDGLVAPFFTSEAMLLRSLAAIPGTDPGTTWAVDHDLGGRPRPGRSTHDLGG